MLERVVRNLIDDNRIELYAGDKKLRWNCLLGTEYTEIVNRRTTTPKKVIVDLVRHLGLEIQDNPPQKATFSLVERVEEDDDE